MTTPLLSVIIPSYNSALKLDQTLQSVLAFKDVEIEVIVVDGNSADKTLDTLKKYPSIRWKSEPDKGPYDAMNKGIQMASGKYFYFLGTGDIMRPHALQGIVPLFQNDAVQMIYGDVYMQHIQRNYGGPFSNWRLSRENICHQAIFYHHSVFPLVGNYEIQYPVLADYAVNLRCFGNKRIQKRYVSSVVADFEGGGISACQTDPQFIKDRLNLIRENLGLFPFVINQVISLVPPGWKEARYQAYRRFQKKYFR